MLTQKIRKLRSMQTAEITSRLSGVLRRYRERRIWKQGGEIPLFTAETVFDAEGMIESCQQLVVGSQLHQIQNLKRQFPEFYSNLQSSAKETSRAVLSGRRIMLGHATDLQGVVDWHTDPKTGYRWERHFYSDIPIGGDGPDIKYIWEVNRHQYLVDLARSWLLARDESAAAHAEAHLMDWIDHNRLYEGVNWTSALEVAMRAVSWTWTVAGIAERLDKGSLQTIANGLADHATYLQHHLSYYSSPFNHLIGEATGLYLISFVLRQHARSDEWRRLARNVLIEYGPRQFYGDGFGVEQAMGYHFFTLGFLTFAVHIARREGCPFTELEEVVQSGYLAAAAFRRPDGTWPAIGDLDSARSLPVYHQDYWRFGSLCSLAAVLFDDTELAFDDEPGDELYWLMGVDGLRRWDQLAKHTSVPKRAPERQHVLADSGYAVATHGNDWLMFDAGPIAGGLYEDSTPSTAHGHADMLQVLYWMDGSAILSDSGIPSYASDSVCVNFFRSPAAHNTLEVDGTPVARVAGHLAWSNVVTRHRLDARLRDDVWLARGIVELDAKVVIRRYLLAIPENGLWVVDWIESNSPRDVTWYWQLGDRQYVVQEEENTIQLRNETDISVNVWSHRASIDWTVTNANVGSPVGWEASEYAKQNRGSRLSLRVSCEEKLLLATYIGRTSSRCKLERVSVHGQLLDCEPGEGAAYENDTFGAEIAWTVSDGDDALIYLAGLPEGVANQRPEMREISGKGDWPVFCIDRRAAGSDAPVVGAAFGQGGAS